VLFDYSGDADTWDTGASGHDSKFGIYRSLNNRDRLRDEQVRFADFCASKQSASECADDSVPDPTAGGGAGGSGAGGGNTSGGGGSGVTGGVASSGAGASGALDAAGSDVGGGNGGMIDPGTGGVAVRDSPVTTASDPDSAAGCSCRLAGSTSNRGACSAALLALVGGWLRTSLRGRKRWLTMTS
jgi:hypothetical protein